MLQRWFSVFSLQPNAWTLMSCWWLRGLQTTSQRSMVSSHPMRVTAASYLPIALLTGSTTCFTHTFTCCKARSQHYRWRECRHWVSASQHWASGPGLRLSSIPVMPASSKCIGMGRGDKCVEMGGQREDWAPPPDPMPHLRPGSLTQDFSSLHWPNSWHGLK